uniref:C2H2-type domain-containing protein n=1 Tax=Neolamprologus brichardi TaxID=32507 RepID=A0A3Q4G7M0_NEOBR
DQKPNAEEDPKAVQYQCSECEMSFTDGLVLISHLEDHGRQEQEKKRNTCPKCGRVCTSQGNLEKHMRMHTGDQKFPCFDYDVFSCRFCSKSYAVKKSLARHYRNWHPKHEDSDSDSAPYFPCHVCGKTFPTSESLEDHQLCHLGEKPHECEQCGKCFFQASQLQQHHRIQLLLICFLLCVLGKHLERYETKIFCDGSSPGFLFPLYILLVLMLGFVYNK